MATTLRLGDCLEVMRGLPDASVDALICDPPAGIAFMGKAWDSDKGGRDHWIAWLAEVLTECRRVMKPGAYALVWALPRTSHWTGMAIEDAGLVPRDQIAHMFGSGFPKSHNISAALDKAAGAEREVIGVGAYAARRPNPTADTNNPEAVYGFGAGHTITAPATDLARQWAGWGTALKPGHEKWILAQKMPDYATIGANLLAWEGDLCELLAGNAETSSIPSPAPSSEARGNTARSVAPTSTEGSRATKTPTGEAVATNSAAATSESTSAVASIALNMVSSWRRIWDDACDLASRSTIATASSLTTDLTTWSLSLCRLTLPTIIAALTNPAESIASVSTAERLSHAVASKLSAIRALSVPVSAIGQGPHTGQGADEASPGHEVWWLSQKPLEGTYASNVARWGVGGLNIDGCRIGGGQDRASGGKSGENRGIYSPRTPGYERPTGGRWPANVILDEDAGAELDAASGTLKSPKPYARRVSRDGALFDGGIVRDGNAANNYGDCGGASRFFYCAKASRSERGEGNDHPCVKSLSLMKWLVRLVTPPNGTILDPFAGSFTTGVAAIEEGFNFIGIEKEEEYFTIAQARIAHAEARVAQDAAKPRALPLFGQEVAD